MVSDGVQFRRKEEVSLDSHLRAYQTQIYQIYQNRCSNIPDTRHRYTRYTRTGVVIYQIPETDLPYIPAQV